MLFSIFSQGKTSHNEMSQLDLFRAPQILPVIPVTQPLVTQSRKVDIVPVQQLATRPTVIATSPNRVALQPARANPVIRPIMSPVSKTITTPVSSPSMEGRVIYDRIPVTARSPNIKYVEPIPIAPIRSPRTTTSLVRPIQPVPITLQPVGRVDPSSTGYPVNVDGVIDGDRLTIVRSIPGHPTGSIFMRIGNT